MTDASPQHDELADTSGGHPRGELADLVAEADADVGSRDEATVVNTRLVTIPAPWSFIVWVAGVSWLLDQVTKFLAVKHLTWAIPPIDGVPWVTQLRIFLNDTHPVSRKVIRPVEDFFAFRYVENPGAAFGMMSNWSPGVRIPFFLTIAIFAAVFILRFYRLVGSRSRDLAWSLSLILGGALGNATDRALRGYVIDFIDFHWYNRPGMHWPTFNIADVAISIGAVLIIREVWSQTRESGDGDSREWGR